LKVFSNGKIIADVEVADSMWKRIRGLMFRRIDEKNGLLLPFNEDKRWEIWMPFVPQKLGLIFLDSKKRVVDVKVAVPLTLDPRTWRIYKPDERCRYVLEIHPEKVKSIKPGDTLEWSYD